ncbi:MAG: FHA domain-containing protein [Phycisphaerae bacterium]
MLNTQIRAAEAALEKGRIDEALQCAVDPQVQKHARAEQFLDNLARMLLARARLAAQNGDNLAALDDLDRLAQINRESADARLLRNRVLSEQKGRHENVAAQRAAYDRAAKNLKHGRLESGRIDIERIPDEKRRAELLVDLDGRLARINQSLDAARAALKSNDVLAAARIWQQMSARHGNTEDSDAFARVLANELQSACEHWYDAGELDRLFDAQDAISAIAKYDPDFSRITRITQHCRDAAQDFKSRDYQGLRQTMLRLQALRKTAWLNEMLRTLDTIVSGQDALLASPFGAIAAHGEEVAIPTRPLPSRDVIRAPHAAATPPAAGRSRNGTLMLIDGGGSSLWLSQSLVRIGRVGGHDNVEVPIAADIRSLHAEIAREEDDYFLIAHGPTTVNRKPVSRTLLRDSDRVQLGDHTKFTFRQPSARSPSAVLVMHHRSRLPHDVSAVVLFAEAAIIGPGPTCHVRTRDVEDQVVVFAQNGDLNARRISGTQRGNVGDSVPIELGQTMEIGDVRITSREYDPTASGGLA